MGTKQDSSNSGAQTEFEELGDGKQPSIVHEFLMLVFENKKWWMIPIGIVLGLFGLLFVLAATGAAPFIYTLF